MVAKNILVVDDDAKCREFIQAFLAYKGYTVSLAKDALEALTITDRGNFDLVITDLMMPGMNGLDFLKRLKARQPEVVVIVSSLLPSSMNSFGKPK